MKLFQINTWSRLAQEFKHMFLVFKQHYTYFHILFHLYVFPKNTNNVIRTTLPNNPLVSTFVIYFH